MGKRIVASLLVLVGIAVSAPALATDMQHGEVIIRQVDDFDDSPRTIRIYLPPGYGLEARRYPVLYMHDAQNLFDDASSYAGEWQIDETLDRLAHEQDLKLIVVGIDHGEQQRLLELSPWTNSRFGDARGQLYADFIVNTLKPLIDAEYHTSKSADNTGIMGSSMGGLMSHYMLLKYPNVFSKGGIFSPSYWYSDEVKSFTASHPPQPQQKAFLVVGGKEGESMKEDALAMYQQLLAQGKADTHLRIRVEQQAQHNEAFWRQMFPQAVSWLFSQP